MIGLDAVQLELKISAEKILPVRLLLCRLLLGNMCVNAGLHSALSTAPSCDGAPGLLLLKGELMLRRCVGPPCCPERVNVAWKVRERVEGTSLYEGKDLERSFGGDFAGFEGQSLERTLR